MGLSVSTRPTWEEDSHGYINRTTTEMNIHEYCNPGLMHFSNIDKSTGLMQALAETEHSLKKRGKQ